MASWLDKYRDARQAVRNVVPQAVRSVARGALNAFPTSYALPYLAEQAIGAFIPGPGQTGGDYIPSYFSGALKDNRQGLGGAYPQKPTDTVGQQAISDTSFGQFGVSGGGASAPQNLVEYPTGSGFYYDLNDPAQKQAFIDRRLVDLQSSRDEALANIDQQIADLTGSSKDYVKNYFKQLEDFTGTKRAGDINRIDVFSAASPNAFQSSEAASYDVANKNYLRGLGEAATEANKAVGAEYLANPEDTSLLGADTTYGRQRENLFSGRNTIGQQYNDYLAGLMQLESPDTNAFTYNPGVGTFNAPGSVNLARYNPFVDFRSVASGATPGAGFTPAGAGSISENTPLENFLGKTKISSQDQDFLRNYLLGRA